MMVLQSCFTFYKFFCLNSITIMFENHYHAADDQIRRTKECVEIYGVTGSNDLEAIETALGNITAEGITA